MKIKLLLFLVAILSFSACLKDTCKSSQTYLRYEPIYKKTEEIRNFTIKMGPSKDLKNPGKIYTYGQYLLINEINEGLHIIDNTNPKNPVKLGFIEIPGNIDMAIQNNILYADNYIDLLAIDISNIQNPTLLTRKESVFPEISKSPDLGYLVGYHYTKVSLPCNSPKFLNEGGILYYENSNIKVDDISIFYNGIGTVPITGIGGSMARFTLAANHLYTIDNSNLKIFHLSNPQNPSLEKSMNLGWGIETIFPYKDKLFIGSNTGMFIYSNTNPSNPTFLSTFTHSFACDPVFATDTRAYITLRRGNTCSSNSDQLDVVDITDLKNPKLLKTYPMFNPRGLSVNDKTLYLCDDGFKVFNIEDDLKIDENRLSHINNIDTYDVIHLNDKNVAMVVGKDGLYQYNTQNNKDLILLSKIPIVR